MPDYAKLDVDNNSNQIILEGDVGLAKRCQEIINVLDVSPFSDTRTETFRLRNADATLVSDAITAIFSGSGSTASAGRTPARQNQRPDRIQIKRLRLLLVVLMDQRLLSQFLLQQTPSQSDLIQTH